MKYCCDRMKQAIEQDELRDCGGRWWYSDISMWVYDCPFCTRCPFCERRYKKKRKSNKGEDEGNPFPIGHDEFGEAKVFGKDKSGK